MARMNRKYKDSVFTDLFGSDRDGKRNFLELYNALSGKNLIYEESGIESKCKKLFQLQLLLQRFED